MDTRCNCEAEFCHPMANCRLAPYIQAEFFGLKVTLCMHCYHHWVALNVDGALRLTDELEKRKE